MSGLPLGACAGAPGSSSDAAVRSAGEKEICNVSRDDGDEDANTDAIMNRTHRRRHQRQRRLARTDQTVTDGCLPDDAPAVKVRDEHAKSSLHNALCDRMDGLRAAVAKIENTSGQINDSLLRLGDSVGTIENQFNAAATDRDVEIHHLQKSIDRLRKQRDETRLRELIQRGNKLQYQRNMGYNSESSCGVNFT